MRQSIKDISDSLVVLPLFKIGLWLYVQAPFSERASTRFGFFLTKLSVSMDICLSAVLGLRC